MTEPTNTFRIAFDTKREPDTIIAVQVTLEEVKMGEGDVARVDLADHPLYPQLVQYVKANPR